MATDDRELGRSNLRILAHLSGGPLSPCRRRRVEALPLFILNKAVSLAVGVVALSFLLSPALTTQRSRSFVSQALRFRGTIVCNVSNSDPLGIRVPAGGQHHGVRSMAGDLPGGQIPDHDALGFAVHEDNVQHL